LAVTGLVNCDDSEEHPAIQRAEDRAAELARQLEAERRAHARDQALADTEQVQARQDYETVALSLVCSGIGMAILVLLLARERRARRVLERLLRLILDRLKESRSPPDTKPRPTEPEKHAHE
jgi:hypothetical protein